MNHLTRLRRSAQRSRDYGGAVEQQYDEEKFRDSWSWSLVD
jgi:hypothetical protein